MQDIVIATITVFVLCIISTNAMYINDDDKLNLDPQYLDSLDLDARESDGLRKLLLKKLRFREIMKEHMKPPEEILQSNDNDIDNNERHRTSKRHKMDDLMSRVQAYLNSVKERQIKESMSLPSLRFGRSGLNWKDLQ
ncbi:hypothetical protein ACF0H5_022018 [Mactra antiquata]